MDKEQRQALRAALQRLVARDGITFDQRDARLVQLNAKFGASITPIKTGNSLGGNCLAYALGLTGVREYLEGLSPGRPFANSEFVRWLLERDLLKETVEGSLVLYYSARNWRHAGLLAADGLVTSKWNLFGLFTHRPLETPRSYGAALVRFVKPDAATSFEWFGEFSSH